MIEEDCAYEYSPNPYSRSFEKGLKTRRGHANKSIVPIGKSLRLREADSIYNEQKIQFNLNSFVVNLLDSLCTSTQDSFPVDSDEPPLPLSIATTSITDDTYDSSSDTLYDDWIAGTLEDDCPAQRYISYIVEHSECNEGIESQIIELMDPEVVLHANWATYPQYSECTDQRSERNEEMKKIHSKELTHMGTSLSLFDTDVEEAFLDGDAGTMIMFEDDDKSQKSSSSFYSAIWESLSTCDANRSAEYMLCSCDALSLQESDEQQRCALSGKDRTQSSSQSSPQLPPCSTKASTFSPNDSVCSYTTHLTEGISFKTAQEAENSENDYRSSPTRSFDEISVMTGMTDGSCTSSKVIALKARKRRLEAERLSKALSNDSRKSSLLQSCARINDARPPLYVLNNRSTSGERYRV